jgi:hypothetical protein
MMRKLLCFALICVLCGYASDKVQAQVAVGGLIDLELRHGGKDSKPGLNQTPKSGTNLYTPNLRLFVDGQIDPQWGVTAVLQSDFYARTDLSPVFFSMLAIRYQPWLDKSLVLSAGRLIIPFGSYSNRFLSNENAYRHLPLTHEWTLPVDKMIGYTMGQRSYESFPGMTMIYNRMYTQGISVSGILGENRPLEYDLLWGMAAPSGFYEYSMYGMSAVMGRVVWQPFISTRIGLSGGYGPYMKPATQNDMIAKKDLGDYKQVVLGADLEFSYRYVILRLEYLNTDWSAPHIERNTQMWTHLPTLEYNSTGEWKLVKNEVNFASNTYSAELEIRVATVPGLTLVSRFDYATFNKIYMQYVWDGRGLVVRSPYTSYPDLFWFEGGINYTINRNVLLKVTYMRPTNNDISMDAQTIGAQLSVSF